MKNVLLFVFISCSILSYGQKIRFTDTSNTWLSRYTYWGGIDNTYFEYYDGDTSWNGLTYRKLTGQNATGGFLGGWEFIVREDTAKSQVYYRVIKTPNGAALDTTEYLGYDFGLKVGDTMIKRGTNFIPQIAVVDRIDSVLIQNVFHKVWYFQMSGGSPFRFSYTTIEGVGDEYGPTHGFIASSYMGGLYLICFTTNNTTPTITPPVSSFDNVSSCLLSADDIKPEQHRITFYPNRSDDGIFHVDHGNLNATGMIEIYNSHGIKVKQEVLDDAVNIAELPKGIYYYRIKFNNVIQPVTGRLVY